MLTLIGAAILITFLGIHRLVHWGNVFRATTATARAEAGPAMLAFMVCFALNVPLDVVQRAQLGLQQGFLTNFWEIFSSILILAGILAVVHFHLSLTALVVAFAGAPVLGTWMNAGFFFGVSRRDLLPKWSLGSITVIKKIASLGGLFFVLQLVAAVSFSTDNFIIARILGVADVTGFSIPQRIFAIIATVVTMLMMPLWPAYGEAMSRGDMHWVRRTLSRTMLSVFVFTTVVSGLLLLFSNKLLSWWVGPSIHPSLPLMLGLAVWAVLSNCGNTLGMFLNGIGVVKFQVILACIFGVGCLILKILFTRMYGVAGVPWATVITYSLLTVLPYTVYVP